MIQLPLTQITLPDGTERRSPRAEVAGDILELLTEWIKGKLGSGKYHPIPTHGLEMYSVRVFGEEEGFLGQLAGIRMPRPGDPPGIPLLLPLIAFGAADSARGTAKVWPLLRRLEPAAPTLPPAHPWCAEVHYATPEPYPGDLSWAHDFQRCLAWTWFDYYREQRT